MYGIGDKALFWRRLVPSIDSSAHRPLGFFGRFLAIGDIDWPLLRGLARLLFFHTIICLRVSNDEPSTVGDGGPLGCAWW